MKLPGPLNDDQEKQLRTVQGSARHLLTLINDLLDLAKIEAGKVELHLEPTLCQEVVDDVSESLKTMAEAKGLRFTTRVPAAAVTLQSDRRALSQIILNLANNAIKFTESGSVTLELARFCSDGKGTVEIRVADTGIGIGQGDQLKLFNAFTQVGESGSSRHSGTGLGLHLSQKLAELLGGHITCSSTLGEGSTFILQLPAT
jgi:protein-histidine pros-kinase